MRKCIIIFVNKIENIHIQLHYVLIFDDDLGTKIPLIIFLITFPLHRESVISILCMELCALAGNLCLVILFSVNLHVNYYDAASFKMGLHGRSEVFFASEWYIAICVNFGFNIYRK